MNSKTICKIQGLLASAAVIACFGVFIFHSYKYDREQKCMEMRTINQCFSDASCTRTSEDFFRRAELEKILGNKCELNIKAR